MPSSPSSSTYSGAGNADAKSAAESSPTTTMTSTPSELDTTTTAIIDNDNSNDNNNNNNNSLDDIFGSSPVDRQQYTSAAEHSRPGHDDIPSTSAPEEPSDIPSLRRQHATAGYRDGIANSKSEHVQRGFDGGYPVGAQFGLRVGTILGIFEGVVGGLESSTSGPVKKRMTAATTKHMSAQGSAKISTNSNSIGAENGEEAQAQAQLQRQRIERIKQLYKNALKDLDVEALFGGLKANDEGEGPDFTEETKPENRLRQKADPVIARWEKLVDVTRWEESMEAIDSMEDQDVVDNDGRS